MILRLHIYLLLLLVSLISVSNLSAQEIQKLKLELNNLPPKNQAINCLQIALLHIEKYGGPDSVIYYAQKAQNILKSINKNDHQQVAQLYLAIGYQQKNQFDTAIVLLKNNLEKNINIADSLKADIYYYLGIVYYRMGDKKTALEYILKSIPLYEKNSNTDGLVLAYCKLSDVLVTDLQNKEADVYKNKAIALFPYLKKPYTKIFSRNVIARIYMDLRSISPNYIDSSIALAKESYLLMKEYGYYTRAFQILNIISDNYFIKEDYETGIEYCKESLKYRGALYPGELILSYVKFSDYYTIKGQYQMALNYLDSVKHQLPKINVQYYWLNYYQRAYDINKKAGKALEALLALEQYNNIKDSLYNVDKSKEINELVQKYDKVENEKKILELNNEKKIATINTRFLIVAVIASFFAIIIIVFFYRQSITKSKIKSIETEQRLNRARMDPHFFFNILSSLRVFALKENNAAKTAEYLTKYSKIMRQSLESSYNELITIETELDFLNNYFEIQKLRYPGRFDYTIKFSNESEISELMIPSMIIQPFVENAIEHGFAESKQLGTIALSFETLSNELKISIVDNGVGLTGNHQEQKAYPSRATQIVNDRLFLLNKQHKSHARFEINKNEGDGLSVTIYLPLIYSN